MWESRGSTYYLTIATDLTSPVWKVSSVSSGPYSRSQRSMQDSSHPRELEIDDVELNFTSNVSHFKHQEWIGEKQILASATASCVAYCRVHLYDHLGVNCRPLQSAITILLCTLNHDPSRPQLYAKSILQRRFWARQGMMTRDDTGRVRDLDIQVNLLRLLEDLLPAQGWQERRWTTKINDGHGRWLFLRINETIIIIDFLRIFLVLEI